MLGSRWWRDGSALLACVILMAPGQLAEAAPTWTITPTPNAATASGDLYGVSCASASFCLASGGSYVSRLGATQVLAELWNGSSWALKPARLPVGSQSARLNAVSCPTSSSCTAVGQSQKEDAPLLALAEQWNGSSWSLHAPPAPSGSVESWLVSASCTTATSCIAVGQYTPSTGPAAPLADLWNGSTWKSIRTAIPAGDQFATLSSVSCSSAASCLAVGNYIDASGEELPLTELWNGSTWTIESPALPSGTSSGVFWSVSCPAATWCAALGSANGALIANSWNGNAWSMMSAPLPGGGVTSFSGLSCPSTGTCTAVGTYTTGPNTAATLAEGWNGSSWTIESTSTPPGATSAALSGVACVSATVCEVAGGRLLTPAHQHTLAEGWNGSGWTLQVTVDPATAISSYLGAVSCPSSSSCFAVGGFGETCIGCGGGPLAEHWSGTTWSSQKVPKPSGAHTASLSGVACASVTFCMAVGQWSKSKGGSILLAERWNGSQWTLESPVIPAGAQSSVLASVSCWGTSACTAVGSFVNSAGATLTLAETWRSTSAWSIETSPNPAGSNYSLLTGVSCVAQTACSAVGWYVSSSGTDAALVEVWNGSSWALQAAASPAGAQSVLLEGVSCSADNNCIAVGSYGTATTNPVMLVDAWNGLAWSVQATAAPTGTTTSGLNGVSCTATTCLAAGFFSNGSTTMPLIMSGSYGASWVSQPTPNPVAPHGSFLLSVACQSATSGLTVGYYSKEFQRDLTLGEALS